MTEVLNGGVASPTINATNAPSKSRPNRVQATISGLSDPVAWAIAIGSSVAEPTTFGGLGGGAFHTAPADGFTTLSVNFVAGTGTYSAQLTNVSWDLSGATVGDRMWMCLFDLAIPISGTAVIDAVDLGLLVA